MSIVVTIANEAIKATEIRIISAGNILWLIMEVAMAINRKTAPIKLQQEINMIFTVLLVFIFGVLSCVLKIIITPPFFFPLYHKSVKIETVRAMLANESM